MSSFPIEMDQGSARTYTFTLKDEANNLVDLTGCDARMQVRATYGATSPLVNATLMNGKVEIVAPATDGVLRVKLMPADTSGIRFLGKDDESMECVYDIEVTPPSGETFKPGKGTFTLYREVTR